VVSPRLEQTTRRTRVRRANPALVTQRDHALLCDLVRFGALTFEQVHRRHFATASASVCGRRLSLLGQAGYASVLRVWYGGPPVCVATPRGASLADVGLKAARLAPETAAHQLAVVDLAEWCLAQAPESAWVTERELRRDAGRAAYAASAGRIAHGMPHMPDGLLVCGDQRVAIELELSAKTRVAYERILRWYAGQPEFDRVRWFVRSELLRGRIQELVRVHGLEQFMTAEAMPGAVHVPSWRVGP
jgi:hypothetical protein